MNGTGNADMPNNQNTITIVVIALAVDGFIGMCALAWCLVTNTKPDPTLLTAFCSLTSGLTGVLGGMLMTTRPSTGTSTTETKPEKGNVTLPEQTPETEKL